MDTAELVRARFGPVEPIVGRGLSNTKLRGDGVLVRVNETVAPQVATERFRKAAFCAEVARAVGVPVPEVHELGTLANGRPYAVERWVDGVPADLVADEHRVRIWAALGAMIRRVHAAPLGGRERELELGYDGEGPTETWAEHVTTVERLLAEGVDVGLDPARLVAALRGIDLGRWPPGLVHGDLKLDNVLVAGDPPEVVAILDWELARFVPTPLGEWSTSIEPAVLPSKVRAVARTEPERAALIGGPAPDDLWVLYAGDAVRNLGFYRRALGSDRPDQAALRERHVRYRDGLGDDLARLAREL